jgi:hypothetical protein
MSAFSHVLHSSKRNVGADSGDFLQQMKKPRDDERNGAFL